MIKVEQEEVGKETGDCMRASIASVLEIDLQAVPHLTRTNEAKWFSVMYYFFVAYEFVYAGMWWPRQGKRKLHKKENRVNGWRLSLYHCMVNIAICYLYISKSMKEE